MLLSVFMLEQDAIRLGLAVRLVPAHHGPDGLHEQELFDHERNAQVAEKKNTEGAKICEEMRRHETVIMRGAEDEPHVRIFLPPIGAIGYLIPPSPCTAPSPNQLRSCDGP